MLMSDACVAMASSAVVVVVAPLSISNTILEGSSIVGLAVVEEDGGSGGGTVANISGIWIRGHCHDPSLVPRRHTT